jgi:hypothetical protein
MLKENGLSVDPLVFNLFILFRCFSLLHVYYALTIFGFMELLNGPELSQ